MSPTARPSRRGAAALVLGLVATLVSLLPAGTASAVTPRPPFQLPFPCGDTWRLFSYADHNPADAKIDMMRPGDARGTYGSTVVAPVGGTVHEWFDPGGIEIDHGNGWFTVYLHLSVRSVRAGDRVAQGQKIGEVGNVSSVTNPVVPHLHYETLYDDDGNGDVDDPDITNSSFDGHVYHMGSQGQNEYTLTSKNCGGFNETVGYHDPRDGTFHLNTVNAGGSSFFAFGFGPAGTNITPLKGDWDGNGTETIGYHNSSDGTFHLRNTLSSGSSDRAFPFGPAGTTITPLAGDWDGDGIDTIGYHNSADGTFHLRDSNNSGNSDHAFGFGPAGTRYKPLAGDWNGNGTDTIGYWDSSGATFHLRDLNSSGNSHWAFAFGPAGADIQPLVNDWDGNLTDTVGYRNAADATWHLRNSNSSGSSNLAFAYGPTGRQIDPLPGNW